MLGYRDPWPLPDPLFDWPEDIAISAETVQEETDRMEDRIFDLIEFFHDHVSEGIEDGAHHHTYNQCGWHFEQFRSEPAQELFRARVNAVLANYPRWLPHHAYG